MLYTSPLEVTKTHHKSQSRAMLMAGVETVPGLVEVMMAVEVTILDRQDEELMVKQGVVKEVTAVATEVEESEADSSERVKMVSWVGAVVMAEDSPSVMMVAAKDVYEVESAQAVRVIGSTTVVAMVRVERKVETGLGAVVLMAVATGTGMAIKEIVVSWVE